MGKDEADILEGIQRDLTCHTMIVFYSQWFLERNKGNEIY
jgi:hypothetical protein